MVYGPGGSVLVTPMFSPQLKVTLGGWETVLRVVYSSVMLVRGCQLNRYFFICVRILILQIIYV